MLKLLRSALRNIRILKNHCISIERYFSVPLLIRLKMYIHGFTSDQYVLYDLKNNNYKDYISEVERWKTRDVDGKYNVLFDDKLVFESFFREYFKIPVNYAWIDHGEIIPLPPYSSSKEFLGTDPLVIKPVIDGGGGKGVQIFKPTGNYEQDLSCLIKAVKDEKTS